MSRMHPIFEQVMAPFIKPLRAVCERCEDFGEVHDQRCPNHPDFDPTPLCIHCGNKCTCPPHPRND